MTDQQTAAEVLVEGTGRIRPRARLLRTIGAELISSEVVAVIELVRNCYDADASRVELHFRKPHVPEEASLKIRDDGHGMTREVLLGPWLEPATDHKVGDGARSPGGRRRLGSKGVGRFAAQRLGRQLTVFTRAAGLGTELQADFDWDLLDRPDRYLDQLSIPWRATKPQELPEHGTVLRVDALRDTWTADRFEKLKLGLSRLLSPVRSASDPFEIILDIDGTRSEVRPALEHAESMYSIVGEVQTGGRVDIRYRDLSGTTESWERSVFWPREGLTCGPFQFRINAWDLDREPLKYFLKRTGSPFGLRDFRRLVRDHSGISLYRDGFRILPYGESDNDWLRLDRRRVNNPTMRLSNNQIFGWIILGADSNPHLKDQTNREGLVSNEAYTHLQRVVVELLSYFEARRFTARRSLDITWSRRSRKLPGMDGPDAELERALDKVVDRADARAVKSFRELLEQRRQTMTETVAQYASLASVGQLSGLVFSQLDHPLRMMESELSLLDQDLDGEADEETLEDLWEGVQRLKEIVARTRLQMKKLDPLALASHERRVVRCDLRSLADEVREAFDSRLKDSGIAVEIDGRHEVDTVPSLVQQAFANVLSNAIDALESEKGGRGIRIDVRRNGYRVSNTGQAIDPGVQDRIFDPHFTTREGRAGLGLTLAAEMMGSIGGRVRLLPHPRQVTFEIQLAR